MKPLQSHSSLLSLLSFPSTSFSLFPSVLLLLLFPAYRGSAPDDWGKGTFTVREDTNPKQLLVTLSECGPKEYVGKTCSMIYKIEDGALTAAASEPGNPAPLTFDAPNARRMVFKRE